MQVDDVGLREGVFVRRYMMTGHYGKHEQFNAEILKAFIRDIMEPDYLLVQDAYDHDMDKDEDLQKKLEDYKIGLIASNHPGFGENMTIPDEELQKFYEKKKVRYNVDLVLANSYGMADSIYSQLKTGNKLNLPKNVPEGLFFPQYKHYKDITYGDVLHLDVFPKLIELKEGEISKPVYTSPVWTVIVLNKISKNKELKLFEQEKSRLVREHHVLFKHRRNNQFINDLKEKYRVAIHTEYYPLLIDAYTKDGLFKGIVPSKNAQSDLEKTFLKINDTDISLSRFISIFNQANQLNSMSSLSEADLSQFIDKYIQQYVLYLDALALGVDKDELIMDKLENKEFRLLLSKYLKEKIASKVVISEAEARQYHADSREKWSGAFENTEKMIRFELRDKKLHEIRNDMINKLQKKHTVRYNEPLLEDLAILLTEEKQAKAGASTKSSL